MNACSHNGSELTGAMAPKIDIATIFREHAGDYARTHVLDMQQRRVLDAITSCRTPQRGGHVWRCTGCTNSLILYNSCRNRHCPTCLNAKQSLWLAQRESRILPTSYFHVVLTLPEQLRTIVYQNQRALLGLLMRAAAETLLTLGRDSRHLGAELGISTVLHTWTRTLIYHPHVHCLVTAGGLSLDRSRWVPTRSGFLFATKVVQRLFRGRFMAGLCSLYLDGALTFSGSLTHLKDPPAFQKLKHELYEKTWVVYTKAPFSEPQHLFAYLGRYTHRVGITNARLRHVDAKTVVFVTRNAKTTTVTPLEFMRRFMLHTLPAGFVKIRHYGLMAGRHVHTLLAKAREVLDLSASTVRPRKEAKTRTIAEALLSAQTWQERLLLLTGRDIGICQRCGSQMLAAGLLPRCNSS
jgi:hypothetical protein